MTMYDYVWFCMIMYDYVWVCMTLYDNVWLCNVYSWLCMTMYGYVWLFRCVSISISANFADRLTYRRLALFGLVKLLGVLNCPVLICMLPYGPIGKIKEEENEGKLGKRDIWEKWRILEKMGK